MQCLDAHYFGNKIYTMVMSSCGNGVYLSLHIYIIYYNIYIYQCVLHDHLVLPIQPLRSSGHHVVLSWGSLAVALVSIKVVLDVFV